MDYIFDSPYNISAPEPIFAGSSYDFRFDIHNPFSDQIVDLTNTARIEFRMNLFGTYDDDLALTITSNDVMIGNRRKINIDDIEKGWIDIHLLPEDTKNFDTSIYDYQIKLYTFDGQDDKVIGRGKIRVYKEI